MNQSREDSSLPLLCSWEFLNGIFSICSSGQTKTTCATEATPHHDAIIEPAQKVELTTKKQPTRDVKPIIKEEPTPDVDETTEADEKVSRFEIVVAFSTTGSVIASLTHSMLVAFYTSWMRDLFTNAVHGKFKVVREVQHESE
jgi:pheromone shutdown protein TraB